MWSTPFTILEMSILFSDAIHVKQCHLLFWLSWPHRFYLSLSNIGWGSRYSRPLTPAQTETVMVVSSVSVARKTKRISLEVHGKRLTMQLSALEPSHQVCLSSFKFNSVALNGRDVRKSNSSGLTFNLPKLCSQPCSSTFYTWVNGYPGRVELTILPCA